MSLLYKDFGQRINVMLEWLPDRSLQSPQTVPSDNLSYAADVKIIASFADSAQEIVRDMNTFRGRSPTSLIAQGLYMRIHDLIATFDRQCYDAVQRGRQYIAWERSAHPRCTMPSNPPHMHTDAHDDVPRQRQFEPAAWGGANTDDPKTKTSDFKASESMRIPRGREGPIPFHIRTVPQKAAGPPPVPPGRETNGKATHLRNW